jgi:hypothetical protein
MRRSISPGLVAGIAATALAVLVPAASAKVLLVGTYHGVKGQYKTIEAAVKKAKPGDFILVAPGDYKTTTSESAPGTGGDFPAGVMITKPRITLRGMNRNTVIVDGTTKGPACNDNPADQNFGPVTAKKEPPDLSGAGLNGVEVWKARNVDVENLTSCNFLGGTGGDGGTGNEIWWNGGAESGKIGGWGYLGEYLNATSTFYPPNTKQTQVQREQSAAEYGIFSSNWDGGTWLNTYTSNMNDSGYYIGACQQECNQVINNAWAEFNALGYSGSNSGGSLVVENSQFDNNEDGFDTNSQNGDNPPPQNGECPNGGTSPITHTHSCWVFIHNNVHNNNDPNVPAAGSAAAGPVGTGMSISGGRFDTVMDNTFSNNDAWGNIVVPYPDSGPPCTGGNPNNPILGTGSCLYDEWGDAIIDNHYSHDGSYGNPTNGDFEQLNLGQTDYPGGEPTDCFSGNTDSSGHLNATSQSLETEYPTCNGKDVPANTNGAFLTQVLCDSGDEIGGVSACTSPNQYPRVTAINNGLHKLPAAKLRPTMPNPCKGVPKNAWCSVTKKHKK